MYKVFTGKKLQLCRSNCMYNYVAISITHCVVGIGNVRLFKNKWKIALKVQNRLNAVADLEAGYKIVQRNFLR